MEDKRRIHIVSNDYSGIKPFIRARNERFLDKVRQTENERLLARIAVWGKWIAIGFVALGICILLARSFFRFGDEAIIAAPTLGSAIIAPGTGSASISNGTPAQSSEGGGSSGGGPSSGSNDGSGQAAAGSKVGGESIPQPSEGVASSPDGTSGGSNVGSGERTGVKVEEGGTSQPSAGEASSDGNPKNENQPKTSVNKEAARTEDGKNAPQIAEPIIRYVPVPDPNLSKTIEKTIIVEKPIYIPIDVPTREGVNTKFTIFRNYKLDELTTVVTGWIFPSSAEKEPDKQYCYITRNFGNNVQNVIDLAVANGRGPIVPAPISQEAADKSGFTVEALKQKLKFCEWFVFKAIISGGSEPEANGPDDNLRAATGSGFFINKNGVLITNQHVVEGCNKFWIRLNEKPTSVRLLASSEEDDLALLQFSGGSSPIALKIADQLRLGEQVIALGFPLGDRLGTEVKVTTGNISSLAGPKDDKKYLQFTAPIQPGNSGGPLINDKGLVVGVNTASLAGDKLQNINFAVKTERLIPFLARNKQLVEVTSGTEKLEVPDLVEKTSSSVVQVLCLGGKN